jgi:tetratricopeptide (TPR) repeat protein
MFFIVNFFRNETGPRKEAYESYLAGEQAKTIAERQDAFNKSLKLYSDLASENHPTYGSGKLYYNLGNSYYQLGEYGLAAANYYQAAALRPRSEDVQQNLKQTLKKLGIKNPPQESVFKRIFFFHSYFSLPERLEAFFILGLITWILGSIFIWTGYRLRWLKGLMALTATLSILFLLSSFYTHYVEPLEGVIVNPSVLYRDAGTQYAKVQEDPVGAGIKVEVLSVLQEGQWVKILTPDGVLGFVPADSIRIISS